MSSIVERQIEQLAPDPRQLEKLCAERLRPLWLAADMLSFYPATTPTVCDLLTEGGGYRVDEHLVQEYFRAGYVPRPTAKRSEALQWTATDILRLYIALETRGEFDPLHARHRPKLSQYELESELAIRVGGDEAEKLRASEGEYTTEDLLLMLVMSDDRSEKLAIFATLKRRFAAGPKGGATNERNLRALVGRCRFDTPNWALYLQEDATAFL